MIIDNKIESYASNLENGIPITDYLGEEDDLMLEYLERYLLKSIGECDDVREVIVRDFNVQSSKIDELKMQNHQSQMQRQEYRPLKDSRNNGVDGDKVEEEEK